MAGSMPRRCPSNNRAVPTNAQEVPRHLPNATKKMPKRAVSKSQRSAGPAGNARSKTKKPPYGYQKSRNGNLPSCTKYAQYNTLSQSQLCTNRHVDSKDAQPKKRSDVTPARATKPPMTCQPLIAGTGEPVEQFRLRLISAAAEPMSAAPRNSVIEANRAGRVESPMNVARDTATAAEAGPSGTRVWTARIKRPNPNAEAATGK